MQKSIIIGALMLIIGIVLGWISRPHRIERVVDIQRDTTVLIETKIIENPVIVERTRKETVLVEVHDTTRIHDTLYLALPMETKIYSGDEYYAEVSGYNASLDYLELFPKTKIVNETKVKSDRNFLSFGMGAGGYNSFSAPVYVEYGRMLNKNIMIYGQASYDLISRSQGLYVGTEFVFGW